MMNKTSPHSDDEIMKKKLIDLCGNHLFRFNMVAHLHLGSS